MRKQAAGARGRALRHRGLTGRIIGAAVEVHRTLGPGLLESAYERCLAHELGLRGLAHARQVPLALRYKGRNMGHAYRADIIVERLVLIEVKAIEAFDSSHEAQLLTYLRLACLPVGLLLNFHAERMRDGILRRVL